MWFLPLVPICISVWKTGMAAYDSVVLGSIRVPTSTKVGVWKQNKLMGAEKAR